jgi:uncharacterized protein (TIGR02001 family)
MHKKIWAMFALAAAGAAPAVSMADTSANVGWVSDYLFRGIYQADSSASAGFDYTGKNGAYLGTWGANVGSGLEVDLYGGYGHSSGKFSWTAGYTGYFYTDNFDNYYNEANGNLSYGIFSLDLAAGRYEVPGNTQNYTFGAITVSPKKSPYFKIGGFGQDFSGSYFELGYGFNVAGLDMSVAMTYSNDLQVTNPAEGESGRYAVTVGFTKTINIGGGKK